MSFQKINKDDLLRMATEEFGIEFTNVNPSKPEIIAALGESGVTWDMAKKFDKTIAAEAVIVEAEVAQENAALKAAEPQTLLRMQRENSTYEIRGYKFTKEHPYGIVSESDAEWIVENDQGFRYATPREAQEFYG